MVGLQGAISYVQLNSSAAVLSFPAASVNVLPATLMVQAPSAVGVNVAVYEVPEPAKSESVPFVTVISAASKSSVLSEAVNVRLSVTSEEVSPSETSAAVMVMVGGGSRTQRTDKPYRWLCVLRMTAVLPPDSNGPQRTYRLPKPTRNTLDSFIVEAPIAAPDATSQT